MNGVQAAIFSGSAMILLVLALRLFLKKHLPRGIFPTLWCAAAVRLLLPITIPTHLSVWNLLHTPATAQVNGVISDVLTPFPSLATNSTANQQRISRESARCFLSGSFARYFLRHIL